MGPMLNSRNNGCRAHQSSGECGGELAAAAANLTKLVADSVENSTESEQGEFLGAGLTSESDNRTMDEPEGGASNGAGGEGKGITFQMTGKMSAEKIIEILKNPTNDSFRRFELDEDVGLTFGEFTVLCKSLFTNGTMPYPVDNTTIRTIFNIFDLDSNGVIDNEEMAICYDVWIKKILKPVSCLLVIDIQNDFISGNLALKNAPANQEGSEVIAPTNWLLDNVKFSHVYYSLDWHPANHMSFADNVGLRELDSTSPIKDPNEVKVYDTVVFRGPPVVEQKLWPRHCVQNTWGSQLHDDLTVAPNGQMVYKGADPEVDSYSALFDNNKASQTALVRYLKEVGATDVIVCGLAYDYCAGSTAIDALDIGYKTTLVDDATRGIDLAGIEEMKEKLLANRAAIVQTTEVKNLVEGVDRKPEHGFHLALAFHKERLAKLRMNEENEFPDWKIGDPISFMLKTKLH